MITYYNNSEIENCKQPFAIYDSSSKQWVAFPKSVVDASLDDYKLWAEGSGRSMTGENKGTLVGIFPKLSLKIGKQNADDRAVLTALLNKPSATVRAYSVERKRFETGSFYFGDVVNKIKKWNTTDISKSTFEPISFSVIANRRRSG